MVLGARLGYGFPHAGRLLRPDLPDLRRVKNGSGRRSSPKALPENLSALLGCPKWVSWELKSSGRDPRASSSLRLWGSKQEGLKGPSLQGHRGSPLATKVCLSSLTSMQLWEVRGRSCPWYIAG